MDGSSLAAGVRDSVVVTVANGGTGPGSQPGCRWDVALSFAGTQRDYVGQVAVALKAQGVRCFYDADEQVRLWGTHLAEELPRIYARESAAVVVLSPPTTPGSPGPGWNAGPRLAEPCTRPGCTCCQPGSTIAKPPGLLIDVVAVDLRRYTPGQFAELVVAKLADLAISPSLPGEVGGGPPGGMRVSEADPRRLGVHAAISVSGVSDEVPPEYVPRDVDAAEHGVRARVKAMKKRGGFVLLVGGSSVGKTRCAFEAVRALLPDWWLVHPAEPGEVAALAAAPVPQTVVWLDELQRYLDGEHGLTGGVVRALLNAPHPAVIIGTLWPDRYITYTAVPAVYGADPYAREREVLDLAAVTRISPAFSPAEQDRARAAAARDPRLRIALDAAGYGLTQTLAAAPQLVARWEDAQTASPYAWAVLTAALDVVRLGAHAPLTVDLLRAAAPGYWTSQQRAEAPGSWFEQALAYATCKLHGTVAALSPVGADIGRVAGYTAADYLIQHTTRERRSARVPASTWDAALGHVRDPADAARIADSARNRLLYRYAIPLYRHAADAGNDPLAAMVLPNMLARRGDLDGLCARADRRSAAARRLADLLAERGDLDGAEQILRAGRRRRSCGRPGTGQHAGQAGRSGRAARPGRRRDLAAARRLADLLAERGDLDGAEQILRGPADAGDLVAARELANMLARRGDLDGLRAGPTPATRTPVGSWPACWPGGAIWTGCSPGPTPAILRPPGGWPICSPSGATSTGPSRSCAARPTPATGTPPGSLPPCSRGGGTSTGPSRSCVARPTPAILRLPGNWPTCWSGAATWTGCAPGPRRAMDGPPGSCPGCSRGAATSTGPSRSCVARPTPATGTPPSS